MYSTVMLNIDFLVDTSLRNHAPWNYEVFDPEEYDGVIKLLDTADSRQRLGDILVYQWPSVEWGNEALTKFLNMISIDSYRLSVLTEGHIYQQGLLVL